MRNINTIYYPYKDKVDALYNKEFTLNNSLSNLLETTKRDIVQLNLKYSYNTDISTLLKSIDTITSNDENVIVKHINKSLIYIKDDIKHPAYEYLKFKFKLLLEVNHRLKYSTIRLQQYKKMKMPYTSFNTLHMTLNNEITKSILRGYSFSIGLGVLPLGKVAVEQIERKFDEHGYPTDRSVNWEESNAFKQELINQGIEPYNKDTAPNGRKWFIYHTEPYIYYINWQISVYIHKLIRFFKFEPSTFINTKNRLKSDVLDIYNSDVEDIINNPKLGFTNRLNYLLKKDPSYALKYTEQ